MNINILFEDISNYYKLSTPNLHVFKKILSFLASIPPGEINTNNIAQNIGKTVIVAPTNVHLPLLSELKNAGLAVQDVSSKTKGAHTGDTGAFQIKDFCKYAIVGHSERHETHEIVMEKAQNCLDNGITPIICFVNPGEAGEYYLDGAMLAWEDPENISKDGVYNAKSTEDVLAKVVEIRAALPPDAKVIYGGSVNENSISELKNIAGLDGVLVGNASLDPKHFLEICTQ